MKMIVRVLRDAVIHCSHFARAHARPVTSSSGGHISFSDIVMVRERNAMGVIADVEGNLTTLPSVSQIFLSSSRTWKTRTPIPLRLASKSTNNGRRQFCRKMVMFVRIVSFIVAKARFWSGGVRWRIVS